MNFHRLSIRGLVERGFFYNIINEESVGYIHQKHLYKMNQMYILTICAGTVRSRFCVGLSWMRGQRGGKYWSDAKELIAPSPRLVVWIDNHFYLLQGKVHLCHLIYRWICTTRNRCRT